MMAFYEKLKKIKPLPFRILCLFVAGLWGVSSPFLLWDAIKGWDESNAFFIFQHWSFPAALLLMFTGAALALAIAWKDNRRLGYAFMIVTALISGHFIFGAYLFPLDGYGAPLSLGGWLFILFWFVLPMGMAIYRAGTIGLEQAGNNRWSCLLAGSLPIVLAVSAGFLLKLTLAPRYSYEAGLRKIKNEIFEGNNYNEAISQCDYLLNNYKKERYTYFLRGIAFYRDKQYENALESFELSLECPPASPDYESERDIFYYMGITRWAMKDHSLAYGWFDKSIRCGDGRGFIPEKNWTIARALCHRGSYYASKGMYSKAITDLKRSSKLLKETSDPFHVIVDKQLEKAEKSSAVPANE